jgi:hypothetical protein
MLVQTIPFLLHTLIEPLAALTFILSPASQLPNPDRETSLISHLLGGALLHSALLALVFVFRPSEIGWDDTGRWAALAFAFWHVWPCHRAIARMRLAGERASSEREKTLGGPVVHLGVHGAFVLMFLWSAMQ